MALLSNAELMRLSRRYATGLSSGAIVDAFQAKGARFSEATLRKYVQLGLLPKSQRVGARGRNRGSVGVYPVVVLRLVNDIKRALERGQKLDEMKVGSVGLGGELHALQSAIDSTFRRFQKAVVLESDRRRRDAQSRELTRSRKALEGAARKLERFAARLARRQVAN